MKILIVGLGAMGTWLFGSLRNQNQLYLWDKDPWRRSQFPRRNVLTSAKAISRCKPEMVIVAVDLKRTWTVMESLIPLVPESTILADITSIKGPLANQYRTTKHPFLSFHPLFGPLFGPGSKQTNKTILLISRSHPKGKSWLYQQFEKPDFLIRELDFEQHDQEMVPTLGLPVLLSLLGLHLLPREAIFGSGLASFIGHGRKVLEESVDLLSSVLKLALDSSLPDRIRQTLTDWQTEMNAPKGEPTFIQMLRNRQEERYQGQAGEKA